MDFVADRLADRRRFRSLTACYFSGRTLESEHSLELLLWDAALESIHYFVHIPANQIDFRFLERFGDRRAIRAAKFEPKADHTIWRVGGIYNSGILDVEAKKWNDPLNCHTRDGHTFLERKREWREGSDIPGSFSAWP